MDSVTSPDGTKELFQVIVVDRSGGEVKDNKPYTATLYLKNLATGEINPLVQRGGGSDGGIFSFRGIHFSSDSQKFAYKWGEPAEHHVYDFSTGDRLLVTDEDGRLGDFSPDSTQILFFNINKLFSFDLNTGGTLEVTTDSKGQELDGEASSGNFSNDGTKVEFYFYEYQTGETHLLVKDLNTGALYEKADGPPPETIYGSDGGDIFIGTSGDDTIDGGKGDDSITGDGGNDSLIGGEGNDTLNGHYNDDVLYGGLGNDSLLGWTGDDLIDGGAGHDRLLGGSGNDTLLGGSGNDYLSGFKGNDTLNGQDGADTLAGGEGLDMLWGGDGQDVFTYFSLLDSTAPNADRIRDFAQGEDKIALFGVESIEDFDDLLITVGATTTLIRDDDPATDFAIRLHGSYALTSEDFLI